jgi:hypothetical protein
MTQLQQNPLFKGTYFTPQNSIRYRNIFLPKNLQFSICKEVFVALPEVIYIRKYFYLLDELSQGIEHLKSSGLIEFWHERGFRRKHVDVGIEVNQPKALNLKDIEGCLYVILSGLLASLIVFCIEIVMKIMQKI